MIVCRHDCRTASSLKETIAVRNTENLEDSGATGVARESYECERAGRNEIEGGFETTEPPRAQRAPNQLAATSEAQLAGTPANFERGSVNVKDSSTPQAMAGPFPHSCSKEKLDPSLTTSFCPLFSVGVPDLHRCTSSIQKLHDNLRLTPAGPFLPSAVRKTTQRQLQSADDLMKYGAAREIAGQAAVRQGRWVAFLEQLLAGVSDTAEQYSVVRQLWRESKSELLSFGTKQTTVGPDRRMNKVMGLMAVSTLHNAEEYTTCKVDAKQDFRTAQFTRLNHRAPENTDVKLPHGTKTSETAVVKWLDYSLPSKANRVRFPAGSPPPPPDFRMWESCRTMSLVDVFPRGSPKNRKGRCFSRFPGILESAEVQLANCRQLPLRGWGSAEMQVVGVSRLAGAKPHLSASVRTRAIVDPFVG
ncbi:hypothetical protein PR048_002693 [Dryococelus australis]|uniref:Uncharacterized protein n=1 Tax=Dryococelus australis TaxID=614101 RepID=A0ABQ9IKY1_9NEOP|nr:hypothetical protein PR048_002693 [Dryococelus australis]